MIEATLLTPAVVRSYPAFARAAICIVALALCSCAAGPRFTGLQGFSETHYESVLSINTGHRYHVFVRVPESYGDSPTQHYPTVYILDGGAMFPKLAGFYHYLRLGEEIPEMFVVGISYGSDRFVEGNYRASDFTAPAPDRDFWGDAPKFQSFLSDELMPLLEQRYRMRDDRRVLFGQSLGAQFVLYSALAEPASFYGRIASNPALHRNAHFFMTHELRATDTPTSLFVSIAEFDAPAFREPAHAWLAAMTGRDDLPWRLRGTTLAGESHFSAAPAAFRNGIRWLFADAIPQAPTL